MYTKLVGPTAPKDIALNPALRYPTALFTVPRPQFTKPTILSQSLMKTLRNGTVGVLQTALARQSTELTLTTERDTGGGVGFFEQGILTGLAIFSTTIVATVGTVGYWTWIAAMRYRSSA